MDATSPCLLAGEMRTTAGMPRCGRWVSARPSVVRLPTPKHPGAGLYGEGPVFHLYFQGAPLANGRFVGIEPQFSTGPHVPRQKSSSR